MLTQTSNASTSEAEARGVFKAITALLQRGWGQGGERKNMQKVWVKKFVTETCCVAPAGLAFSILLGQAPER